MKILVTGATGFLGRFLVKALEDLNHEVTAFGSKDCDLTKSDSLNTFNHTSFDQIYHLAVWVQAGDFNVHHPGEIWVKNQLINAHVLDWWKNKQPQAKMIATGTSCAYEAGSDLIEDNYLKGQPHESVYSYAMTKRMLYAGLKGLNKQFGMKYLCVIPSTLYGPGYHNDDRQLHFIFDLIRKIICAKYQGKVATLWGDGHQKRELVLVQDFVSTLLKLAHTQENQIINMGSGEEHSIRQFAQFICDSLDFDSNLIQYDTSKFVGASSKCLNITKLRTILPDLSYTPLKEGIEQTIQWFLETHKELVEV